MREFIDKILEGKLTFWVCFIGILLIGLILRVSLIDFALWYDEGCSIAAATHAKGVLDYLWNEDLQHTPLYFYILKFIMNTFGDSVAVMRWSSIIVSMALLPLTYIVTEKLSSKRVAMLAMLLMTVNTFQVLYSIEIRMYPYVILLALLSVNYLIDYDKKGDIPSLIKLGIVNLLNPYFLTGAIVFVLAEFIVYTCYLDYKKAESDKITKYVISNILVFLGFIPYIILIVHYATIRHSFLVTDISQFSATNFWGMFQNLVSCDPGHIHETRFEPFFKYIKGNTPEIAHKNSIMEMKVWGFVILPIIMMFVGIINSLRDKETLNHVIFGIITLVFVVFALLAQSGTIAFTGRYIIFIAPFIFILMAVGFSKCNKYFLLSLIILYTVGCVGAFYGTMGRYRNIAEFSLKSPADFAHSNYPGKQNLVIMPFASSTAFYYFKGDDMPRVMPLELFHEVRKPDSTIIYDPEQIEAFKTQDKYRIFQNMILSDKFISRNLTNYLDSYIKSVPKGGYIIWVIYYSDNFAMIPPARMKQLYSNYDLVKKVTSSAFLSKFDIDLLNLLFRRAKFVRVERDLSNSFFVFQRK